MLHSEADVWTAIFGIHSPSLPAQLMFRSAFWRKGRSICEILFDCFPVQLRSADASSVVKKIGRMKSISMVQ
jgi:hypothetical protein